MTHSESQDLLIDLAYGELDPLRAAQLEGHLAGCDECTREKAALLEARRATATLRELEEPPPGFDDRILAAARAQAQLEHDGNVGEVIEVSGSVKPLGLEPAQIDAHARVAPQAGQRRPRWAVRLALGGSVAAAAALALVVSTTLQTNRARAPGPAAQYRINVAPAERAERDALRDGQKPAPKAVSAGPPAQPEVKGAQETGASEPLAALAREQKTARAEPPPARRAKAAADRPAAALGGSGGDVGSSVPAKERADGAKAPAPAPVAANEARAEKAAVAPPAPAAASHGVAQVASAERAPAATAVIPRRDSEESQLMSKRAVADALSAAQIERSAQDARHAGNYVLAAGMYRKAAALRRAQTDPEGSAAWDLAHASECFAAAGMFDEARQVREELVQLYPTEKAAFSAASRAVREFGPPAVTSAPAGAAPPPAAEPSKKAKTEAKDAIPADY
jgi:tetratricopeptide (TPR) repeat protein